MNTKIGKAIELLSKFADEIENDDLYDLRDYKPILESDIIKDEIKRVEALLEDLHQEHKKRTKQYESAGGFEGHTINMYGDPIAVPKMESEDYQNWLFLRDKKKSILNSQLQFLNDKLQKCLASETETKPYKQIELEEFDY